MLTGLLILLAVPTETGAIADLSVSKLGAMCSLKGGLAGPFGDTDIDAEPIAQNEMLTKTWALDPAIGPFTTFERWSQPYSKTVHTLRYEGATSETFNHVTLSAQLHSIAKISDWAAFTHSDPLVEAEAGRRVFKDVVLDGTATRLWLIADGGLETTSLYCQREDLLGVSSIKLWERYAERRRAQEARKTTE